MSNIYNLEPQAFGLIVFKTTFGELELELFTKQCPKISKNFLQLCLDGYYNGTIFDRVEKDFIAIGGKLTTESPIKIKHSPDEFHSRLRFSRRGLVATANEDKNANGPEFFLTLGPAPELQNKHSIFGRLKGDSIYHLVDLNECPVDEDLVPISEKKIHETIVKENPFPDLQPRSPIVQELKRLRGELVDQLEERKPTNYLDPKLGIKSSSKKLSFYQDDSEEEEEDEVNDEKKLAHEVPIAPHQEHDEFKKAVNSDEKSDANGSIEAPSEEARQRKLREVREKFQDIKRQIELDSATKISLSGMRRSQDCDNSISESLQSISSKQTTIEDPDLSNQELRLASKKGRHREHETMGLMKNFNKKLKQTVEGSETRQPTTSMNSRDKMSEGFHDGDDDSDLVRALELVDDDSWLRHKFDATDESARDAKDANMKGDDWYSIDDPRNPIAQRVEAEKAREYNKHRRRDDRHTEAGLSSPRSFSRDDRHRRSGRSSRRENR